MEAAQQFLQARSADLLAAQAYAAAAWADKALPPGGLPPSSVIATALGTLLLAQALVALLHPKSRRFVVDAVDTVLAIALLIVLLAVVVGLPLVIVYLILQGIAFALRLVLNQLPAVDAALKKVGLA